MHAIEMAITFTANQARGISILIPASATCPRQLIYA